MAQSGDTIRLTGDFAGATLQNKTFAKTVTFDATAAKFTDTLKFQNVGNIKLVGGTYDSTGGRTSANRAITVFNSSNVFFDRTTVIGRVEDEEYGILIQNVTNSKVTNSKFTNVGVGVVLSVSTGSTLSNNTVTGSTRDGFDIFGDHNVVANNNTCKGSQTAAGAHPDCIQLLTPAGYAVQSDIKLIDNIATGHTQGFTSFNPENGGGLRITMTGNIVNGLEPQGIACYACVDSVFTGNFLSPQPGAPYFVNMNIIGGSDNTIADNSFIQLKDARYFSSDYATAYFQLTGKIYQLKALGLAGAVPEPDQWTLFIAGFAAIGVAQRRRAGRKMVSVPA